MGYMHCMAALGHELTITPLSFITDASGNVAQALAPGHVVVSKPSTGVYRVSIPGIGRDGVIYTVIPSVVGPNARLTRVVSERREESGLRTALVELTNQWPPADLLEARVDLVVMHSP